jgi:hypothetical protein
MRNDTQWGPAYQAVYGKRPKYELYDLKKDPHETQNLADDPAYATIKADLEKRLLAELTRTGDPRLIDDGKFFESPPMVGPIDDAEGKPKKAKGKGKKK